MSSGAKQQGELVRALSHPIRVEILETLRGRVASPNELSREMDRSVGVIAYHANTLVKCGCLELVGTKPREGWVEHFFGSTPEASVAQQRWELTTKAQRGALSGSVLRGLMDRARRLLSQIHARNRRLGRAR
jgi:predicted transcriptional regulator